MTFKRIIAGFAICSAFSSIALAQQPSLDDGRAAKATVSPFAMDLGSAASKFTIAGVKLGMSYDQAVAAAKASGYANIRAGSKVNTFEQNLRELALKRENKEFVGKPDQVLGGTIGSRLPSGEHLSVSFTPTPRGVIVTNVSVFISKERISSEQFRKLAVAKYGSPQVDHSGQLEYLWCSAVEATCSPMRFLDYSNLTLRYFVQNSLTLKVGNGFWQNLKSYQSAELERRAPKATSMAF